ncbi:hypothetical protein TNCV_2313411 [Trichonephila clavipes]|nr:hypothetical protein TNCV_2313411 [Trichonephila clavipes]
MAGLPGAIFQQDSAQPHTARMSQDCLRHITTLPGLLNPQIFHQPSIPGIIWDETTSWTNYEFGRREACVQQLWNEMSTHKRVTGSYK